MQRRGKEVNGVTVVTENAVFMYFTLIAIGNGSICQSHNDYTYNRIES
jgi:hypothetical protein